MHVLPLGHKDVCKSCIAEEFEGLISNNAVLSQIRILSDLHVFCVFFYISYMSKNGQMFFSSLFGCPLSSEKKRHKVRVYPYNFNTWNFLWYLLGLCHLILGLQNSPWRSQSPSPSPSPVSGGLFENWQQFWGVLFLIISKKYSFFGKDIYIKI